MNNPSKIVMPGIPGFFNPNKWFEAKGRVIQFLDERDNPFGKGRNVAVSICPEKSLSVSDFKLRLPNVSPLSSLTVKIEEDGTIPFPDFMGSALGIFTIIISIHDVNIRKKITITEVLPPELVPQTTSTLIGRALPNATIKIFSFPENGELISTTADSEGIFTLSGPDNIFPSNSQIIQTANNTSSPKAQVKSVLEIPLLTNIQRVQEKTIHKLKGKGRLPGAALLPITEGNWNAYGGNYNGTFNQVFIEIGPDTESIPTDFVWNDFPSLKHTSGAVLIPLPETAVGDWCIDIPAHLVSKKLYIRQALNRNSNSGNVLAISRPLKIDEFDILEHPRSTLVSLGEYWNFTVSAQGYQSIQWQYQSLENNITKFVNWSNDSEGAKGKTLGRMAYPADNNCIFRAKFILPHNKIRFSNPACLSVKTPQGEDISNRFNIPNLKLLKSSPGSLLVAYPARENIAQSLTNEDKTWFVYETTESGCFLRAKFNEKEAANVICARINILGIKVNDQLEFTNTKDALVTCIFDSDFIQLDNDFGVIKASKGNPSSIHKLDFDTEYYIYIDCVLVGHFNTNPQVNRYLYEQDDKGETIERIIARINNARWSSYLRLDVTNIKDGAHDITLLLATTNDSPDSGDIYGQNINGNFVVSVFNPNQPLIIERKIEIYDFSEKVYVIEPGSQKTTLEIANEINALKLKSYRVSLTPFESLLEYANTFEKLPDIEKILSYNSTFKEALELMKTSVDLSETEEGIKTQIRLFAIISIIAHEASLVLSNDITTLEQYEHHIDKHGRIAPLVLFYITVSFVTITYSVYTFLMLDDIDSLILNDPNNLMPTVPVPIGPHFAIAAPAPASQVEPIALNGGAQYTDMDLVGYMNEETYITQTTTWQEFQEGILPSLRPTLEALEAEYSAELIAQYQFPTDEYLENLLPEIRQTFEGWMADVQRVQQSPIVEIEDIRRTLQFDRDQLETELSNLRNIAAWRRRLKNRIYLFIRERTTRRIVGVTTVDVVGMTFVINHTMTHVDQITGARIIPNLHAFIVYSMIKKIKQSSEDIMVISQRTERTVQINQILIESIAITKPIAIVNKQLGFTRRGSRT